MPDYELPKSDSHPARGRVAEAGDGDRVRRGRPGQPRPVHRQRRPARHRAGPARAQPGRSLLGAQRLRDRLRRRCWCSSAASRRATGARTASCSASPCSPSPRRRAAPPPASPCSSPSAIIQAAGAALLTPTSLSLVLATTAPERRQGAVRAWTAIGGLAAALGPVVGGLLVAASWRWVFYVNVPIGLAAIAIGWRRLPQVAGHPVPRPDALGARARHRGRRPADARAGQGQRLGLGLSADDRHAGRGRRRARGCSLCTAPERATR